MILTTSKMGGRAGIDTWSDCVPCKHYFPGNAVNADGRLVDIKGGVIADPQDQTQSPYTPFTFEYDSSRFATRSTANMLSPKKLLYSGSWEPLPAGKSAIFLTAGYTSIDATVQGGKGFRTAIGDFTAGGGDWGMSDGPTSGLEGHVLMQDDAGLTNGSYTGNDNDISVAEVTESVLGEDTYFYRYSAYAADGALLESKVMNQATGAEVSASTVNDTIYNDTNVLGICTFLPYFRMCNYWSTGIALFYFDSLPSDYEAALLEMVTQWKMGYKYIWTYW